MEVQVTIPVWMINRMRKEYGDISHAKMIKEILKDKYDYSRLNKG